MVTMLNFCWGECINIKAFYFPATLLAVVQNDPSPQTFPLVLVSLTTPQPVFKKNFHLFWILEQSNSGIFRFSPVLKLHSKFIFSCLQLRLDLPEGTMVASVSIPSSLF